MSRQIPYNGFLHVCGGSMYSGKSSELYRVKRRYQYVDINVICVTPAKNTRETVITTHNGEKIYETVITEQLKDVHDQVLQYDVILVEEGQFFDDLLETVLNWVNLCKKTVYVFTLDTQANLKVWPQVAELLCHADSRPKLDAVCRACNREGAVYTQCMEKLPEDGVLVGGEEIYYAVCRTCKINNAPKLPPPVKVEISSLRMSQQ
jgi:thymidine kinase